jgi:hypothetical protein
VTIVAVAGLVLIVLVVALALWAARRQRRLYPPGRERVGESAEGSGFTGVGVAEKFRDEP